MISPSRQRSKCHSVLSEAFNVPPQVVTRISPKAYGELFVNYCIVLYPTINNTIPPGNNLKFLAKFMK